MVISASELAGLIARDLAERQTRAAHIVLQGQATDYAAYRESIGYLTALRETAEYVTELTKSKGSIDGI